MNLTPEQIDFLMTATPEQIAAYVEEFYNVIEQRPDYLEVMAEVNGVCRKRPN